MIKRNNMIKSIDNSFEDEDNQREKKGGKDDNFECDSLSENEVYKRVKKPGKDDFLNAIMNIGMSLIIHNIV